MAETFGMTIAQLFDFSRRTLLQEQLLVAAQRQATVERAKEEAAARERVLDSMRSLSDAYVLRSVAESKDPGAQDILARMGISPHYAYGLPHRRGR